MSQTVKIFKLHYSGEIETCDENIIDPIEIFSAVNIISIYTGSVKKLYIWVGSFASRTLKNYIVHFREMFTKNYYDLRVLRYITIESHLEPYNFFEDTGIDRERLNEHITNHERKLLPLLEEINKLKRKQDELFESEDYEAAIKIAYEIIKLAKKIDDAFLEKDQEDFINGAQFKAETKKVLLNIENGCILIKNKIDDLNTDNNIIELHNYIEKFKENYDKYFNLIESQKQNQIEKLISIEKQIWQKYSDKVKEIDNLSKLESEIKKALVENELNRSKEILVESQPRIQNLNDDRITAKWKVLEDEYNKKYNHFTEQIIKYEESIEENRKNNDLKEIVDDCRELVQIGKLYKDNDIVNKYSQKLKEYQLMLENLDKQKKIEIRKREEEINKLKEIFHDLRIKALEAIEKGFILKAHELFQKVIDVINEMLKIK